MARYLKFRFVRYKRCIEKSRSDTKITNVVSLKVKERKEEKERKKEINKKRKRERGERGRENQKPLVLSAGTMGNTSDISKLDTKEREKAHWLSREYEKKIVNNNEGRK